MAKERSSGRDIVLMGLNGYRSQPGRVTPNWASDERRGG